MVQEFKTLSFEMEEDHSWSIWSVGSYIKRDNLIANFEYHIKMNILFYNTNIEGLQYQMPIKMAKEP